MTLKQRKAANKAKRKRQTKKNQQEYIPLHKRKQADIRTSDHWLLQDMLKHGL